MSKSIRFLGIAILAWAGVRAVSLGIVPGTEALAFDASSARRSGRLPPIEPTMLPPIEPIGASRQLPALAMSSGASPPYGSYAAYTGFMPYPVYVPMAGGPARSAPPQIIYVNPPAGEPSRAYSHVDAMPTDEQPPGFALLTSMGPGQSTPSFEAPKRPGLDRLSLTGWAMMRNELGPDSLANSGTLGGSEAGARLMWRLTPQFAVNLRASAPVNSQRGAEAAVGIRYQPFQAWPVAATLERRQGFRDYGRNAFALFAEGGVYGRPMPWQSVLDGYFQAGVVDFNNPDWFVDGQIAVSRPIWRNLSGGLGVWGGAQPRLNRLDVGPRLSLRVGRGMRAHLDYRLNVVGNAAPGSGAVVTLAGDF